MKFTKSIMISIRFIEVICWYMMSKKVTFGVASMEVNLTLSVTSSVSLEGTVQQKILHSSYKLNLRS